MSGRQLKVSGSAQTFLAITEGNVINPICLLRVCVCQSIMAKGLSGTRTVHEGTREVRERSGVFIYLYNDSYPNYCQTSDEDSFWFHTFQHVTAATLFNNTCLFNFFHRLPEISLWQTHACNMSSKNEFYILFTEPEHQISYYKARSVCGFVWPPTPPLFMDRLAPNLAGRCTFLGNLKMPSMAGNATFQYHPGVAENIGPIGGPGSDVIVEGIPPWDNSWVQDGSFYTLTKAECFWGVAKVWPISSGQ